jgi:hypothetical protein
MPTELSRLLVLPAIYQLEKGVLEQACMCRPFNLQDLVAMLVLSETTGAQWQVAVGWVIIRVLPFSLSFPSINCPCLYFVCLSSILSNYVNWQRCQNTFSLRWWTMSLQNTSAAISPGKAQCFLYAAQSLTVHFLRLAYRVFFCFMGLKGNNDCFPIQHYLTVLMEFILSCCN